MTIYIDDPIWEFRGKVGWCHMITDGDIEELHDFAVNIMSMKREWFQNKVGHPHYDIYAPRKNGKNSKRRQLFIKNGAVEISSVELVKICKERYRNKQ